MAHNTTFDPPPRDDTHTYIISLASEQSLNVLFSEEQARLLQIGLLIFNWLQLTAFHHGIQRGTANLEPFPNLFCVQQGTCRHLLISLSVCTSHTKYTTLTSALQASLDISLYTLYNPYIANNLDIAMYESEVKAA